MNVKIQQLPLRNPTIVERGESLRAVVEAMKIAEVGGALVCENGKLVGLFTERDLLNKVIGESVDYSSPVEAVMTQNPSKLRLDDAVLTAMELMRQGDYRNIPLVDERGQAAGIVTVQDLVTYFAEHFPKEALNLPPDAAQQMSQAEGA